MIERLAPDTNAVIALFASNPSIKAMLGAAERLREWRAVDERSNGSNRGRICGAERWANAFRGHGPKWFGPRLLNTAPLGRY
jgi:hypothetical protein